MNTIIKFFVFNLICWLSNAQTEDILVTTALGSIRGSIMKSRLDNDFYGFRGIKYGKPPTGELRFQPPLPVDSWDGVYDATRDGVACPQTSNDCEACPQATKDFEISEDCLLLNVYTKNLFANFDGTKKPVIVYIHGGAMVFGSSVSGFAGAEHLMDRDVILVTINYRLGSFGFMSTGTAECPGNMGFKDQVLALKWVRDHIKSFGGDPESVTIMGQSAGARSVALHLASPMSTGLFHRAIVMSGSTTTQWKVRDNLFELAKKQADLVGCPSGNPQEIVSCLKTVSMRDIALSLKGFNEFDYHPILKLFPVVEQDFGQERFLVEDPNVSFATGNFNRVPVISGITEHEFSTPAWDVLRKDDKRYEFESEFERVAPICFIYERDTERSKNISRSLKEFYIPGPLNNDSLLSLNNLFSDSITTFGVHKFVHLVAHHTPVFYYKNSYVGRFSHFYHPGNKPYGVSHSDDLQYVIALHYLGPIIKQNDPENITVERMTRMWSRFAATGNPSDSDDDIIGDIEWTEFNFDEENYLNIGNDLVMENELFLERFHLWETLFPYAM